MRKTRVGRKILVSGRTIVKVSNNIRSWFPLNEEINDIVAIQAVQ